METALRAAATAPLAGTSGWVWTVDFQFRAMNLVGETLNRLGDRVQSAYNTVGEFGLVELDTGIVNQDGKESTPGTARVLLPRRGGPALPADKSALLAELAALPAQPTARNRYVRA